MHATLPKKLRSADVRVVIYGEHSQDWMAALAPGAPVWDRMDGVNEVLVVPDRPGASIPAPERLDSSTIVIPLLETHAKNRPRHYLSLVPDDHAIDTLADKAAFAAYVQAQGLARYCPELFESIGEARFPCVLKRVDLNVSRGITITRTPEELSQRLQQAPWAGHRVILQAAVPGETEYVTHCVCKDGQIRWHCSFAYDMNSAQVVKNIKTSVIRTRAVATPPRILSQIEQLLAPLAYDGPCNVDYKISETGDIVVFEINPRLGGSLMHPQRVDSLHGALSQIIDAALN